MLNPLEQQIVDLLQAQRFMVLCTQSEQGPYCSLLAFATSQDLKQVYFCTRRRTRKFQNLLQEPRVSFLVDDRQNQAQDLQQAQALTGIGVAAETAKSDFAAEAFLARHSELTDFLQEKDCALVKVDVQSYFLVQKFEAVQRLDLGGNM
ncbi:MAG: pyridoxamine 5'-phosphate oxidase family protein [Desulfohalobiaceae bacterium]